MLKWLLIWKEINLINFCKLMVRKWREIFALEEPGFLPIYWTKVLEMVYGGVSEKNRTVKWLES